MPVQLEPYIYFLPDEEETREVDATEFNNWNQFVSVFFLHIYKYFKTNTFRNFMTKSLGFDILKESDAFLLVGYLIENAKWTRIRLPAPSPGYQCWPTSDKFGAIKNWVFYFGRLFNNAKFVSDSDTDVTFPYRDYFN